MATEQDMIQEQDWTDVPGYEWIQVTRSGAVRRKSYNDRYGKWKPQKPMVGKVDKTGYMRVDIRQRTGGLNRSCPTAQSTMSVHRLVALAFLPQDHPDRDQVNHKDGCRTNNRLDNLEWVSRSENLLHAARVLGTMGKVKGMASPSSKLTDVDVRDMRLLHAQGYSANKLSHLFRVACTTVLGVVNWETWKHVA